MFIPWRTAVSWLLLADQCWSWHQKFSNTHVFWHFSFQLWAVLPKRRAVFPAPVLPLWAERSGAFPRQAFYVRGKWKACQWDGFLSTALMAKEAGTASKKGMKNRLFNLKTQENSMVWKIGTSGHPTSASALKFPLIDFIWHWDFFLQREQDA